MRRFAVPLFFSTCFMASGVAAPLESLWEKEPLWELSPERFAELAGPLLFRWNSTAHDSARSAGPDLTLGGQMVVEAIARFSEGKVNGLTAALYTRGDMGELTKPDFEALVKRSVDQLSSMTGVRPQVRGKDAHNAAKADGVIWQTPQATWLLEYGMTRSVTAQAISYRPEFIRVEITPVQKGVASLAGNAKVDPKTHIKHTPDGNTWIDGVPMVDQGAKGYCMVAAAERVMRYYGMRTDQNELAQLAGSDSRRGTDLRAGMEALKQAGARLHYRLRVVDDPDVKEFESLVGDYNKRASKTAKEAIIPPLQGSISMMDVLKAMKPEVLREAKLNQKSAMGRFQRSVVASVEAGNPLLWGVALGLVPEPGLPQTAGGHVRLILGYNNKTNKLLYSDSWGAGHELKSMSMEDAWIMHEFSFQILPWQ